MGKWLIYFLLVICPSLTTPTNARKDCPLGGDEVLNPGDTCTFTCDDGYQLMGSGVRTCQNNGSWNGSDTMCISE